MKHFMLSLCIVLSCTTLTAQKNSYLDKMLLNMKYAEAAGTMGHSWNGGFVGGFDFTIGGFIFGVGGGGSRGGDMVYVESPKTVKVSSYTKKNGTHVDSYYRAAPGKGGGSYVSSYNSDITEYYIGYYLPVYSHKLLSFSSAPVVGITKEETNDIISGVGTASQKVMYGAALKLMVNTPVSMGLTLKITNTSICLGLGVSVCWGYFK